MAKKLTVTVGGVEMALPMLPNFIRSAQFEGHSWDVATLTDEQIKKLGEVWTTALLLHAAARRTGDR